MDGGSSDRPGLIVRKATLEPRDITSIERIKTTTAARAILECAAILPQNEDYRLEAMCAEGHSKGAKLPALRRQIERNPGKPGVVRLATVLDRRTGPAKPKRELERRLLSLIRASDLPHPEVNAWLEGKERDLVWRERRVVVETDSYTFHGDPATWAKDIGKTNELQLLGYVVLHFTWFDVTERPGWVIGEIGRALTLRRLSRVRSARLEVEAARQRPALRIESDQAARFTRHQCHVSDRSTGCLAQGALHG